MQAVEDEPPPRGGPRMPPAPIWRDREANQLLGLRMLRELPEEGALSVALWRLLRYVEEWTTTPTEELRSRRLLSRAMPEMRDLMRGARDEVPELGPALAAFARHLREPGCCIGPQLAKACGLVAKWAEAGALIETAAHFAEAAAYSDPDSFRRHRNAGRLCRRLALLTRAEVWYSRAFHLAARAGRRTEAVRALLGYGATLKARGDHDEARKWFKRAAKRAGWANRPKYQAEAHHDLATLEAENGTLSAAIEHFLAALRLYAPSSARVPYLVHDAAYVLIRRHHYTHAIPILQRLLAAIKRPDDRVLTLGSLAKAAGGAGDRARFHEAEGAIVQLAPRYSEYAAAALVHLADGARALGEWENAGRYAATAAQIAAERQDGLIEKDAAVLTELIKRRVPHPPEEEAPAPEEIEELIRRCRWKIQTWKPRKPRAVPD